LRHGTARWGTWQERARLVSFQGGRPTVDGTVVGWRMNAAVRIAEGNETHETLNVIGPNVKKLLSSESSSSAATVKLHWEAALKFHEATQVGVMLLLVGHNPSVGVGVMVKLMLRRLKKRIIKKEFDVRKWNVKGNGRINKAWRHKQTNTMTSRSDGRWPTKCSPWWQTMDAEIENGYPKKTIILAWVLDEIKTMSWSVRKVRIQSSQNACF